MRHTYSTLLSPNVWFFKVLAMNSWICKGMTGLRWENCQHSEHILRASKSTWANLAHFWICLQGFKQFAHYILCILQSKCIQDFQRMSAVYREWGKPHKILLCTTWSDEQWVHVVGYKTSLQQDPRIDPDPWIFYNHLQGFSELKDWEKRSDKSGQILHPTPPSPPPWLESLNKCINLWITWYDALPKMNFWMYDASVYEAILFVTTEWTKIL